MEYDLTDGTAQRHSFGAAEATVLLARSASNPAAAGHAASVDGGQAHVLA